MQSTVTLEKRYTPWRTDVYASPVAAVCGAAAAAAATLRGQGIGSQLLQHVVSDCPHDIYLTTLARTTRFYHKAGFNLLQPSDIPK
jgi:GNAT superfamily N-acetyltransferase